MTNGQLSSSEATFSLCSSYNRGRRMLLYMAMSSGSLCTWFILSPLIIMRAQRDYPYRVNNFCKDFLIMLCCPFLSSTTHWSEHSFQKGMCSWIEGTADKIIWYHCLSQSVSFCFLVLLEKWGMEKYFGEMVLWSALNIRNHFQRLRWDEYTPNKAEYTIASLLSLSLKFNFLFTWLEVFPDSQRITSK